MKIRLIMAMAASMALLYSCETQDELHVPSDLAVNDFIWKGMNLYYLWQPDVPKLQDDHFPNQRNLNSFLSNYNNPIALFNDLRISAEIDRFSTITSDYSVLEGILSGTTKNSGMDYGLRYKLGSSTVIFGWVRYVLPNSDAANKGIQRGDLFSGVDGVLLTVDNYRELLAAENFTLSMADYDNGNITPNGETIALLKTVISENPVYRSTIIPQGSNRIGYLMYNGFYPNYESYLNQAFADLKAQNITHFVLDLRYNSGGSIATATKLASMITGQFTGEVFAKEQWNPKVQAYYEDENPENLRNYFTSKLHSETPISSLNLSKIYILTSPSTASASELVINGLKPFIEVVQIGDKTTGKNVGSITLYDSPSFSRKDRSSKHTYAMQPIVLKVVNADDFGDYFNGISPDYMLQENLGNLGVLGDPTENLLSTALQIIGSSNRRTSTQPEITARFSDRSLSAFGSEMYSEKYQAGR